MSNFVFNSAKGKVAYYAGLPGSSDALIAVAIAASGIDDDNTMIDFTTLSGVLSGSSEHTLARKTLTSVTVTPDNTTNTSMVDVADFTYTAATGAALGALVICYVPNTSTSTNADILPLTKYDFGITPSGADIVVRISTNGIFKAIDG